MLIQVKNKVTKETFILDEPSFEMALIKAYTMLEVNNQNRSTFGQYEHLIDRSTSVYSLLDWEVDTLNPNPIPGNPYTAG